MAALTWKDEYSVKIAEVDAQHKKLIGLIGELDQAMAKRQGKEVVGSVLDKLISYTVTHFTYEENLMRANNFPGYQEHKDKHEKMTAKVLDLQRQQQQGKLTISLEVMDFLKNWLQKHILGTDMQYSAFLNDQGVH